MLLQMPAAKIVLDTNILRQEGSRRSAAFQTLTYLSRKQIISLAIPEIVRREYESYLRLETIKYLDASLENFRKIRNLGITNSSHIKHRQVLEAISSIKGELELSAEIDFNFWIKYNDIEIIEIQEIDYKKTFEDYFLGLPPFKTAKNREDIPDSLIFQTIRRLSTTEENLFVVTSDENLGKNIAKHCYNVTIFKNIKEFIQSSFYKELLSANQNFLENDRINGLRSAVNSQPRILFDNILFQLQEMLDHPSGININPIGGNSSTLASYTNLRVNELSPSSAVIISENTIAIDFTANFDGQATYIVSQEYFERQNLSMRDLDYEYQDENSVSITEVAVFKIMGTMKSTILPQDWEDCHLNTESAIAAISRSDHNIIEYSATAQTVKFSEVEYDDMIADKYIPELEDNTFIHIEYEDEDLPF